MNCSSVLVLSASRLLRVATSLFAALACLGLAARAAETGTIVGSVISSNTHNALQGAVVSVPSANRSVFTDETGRFILRDVPPGGVDLVVSYAGFEEAHERVTVSVGSDANVAVSMKSSDLVTMQAFTVESVKEGQALALTEQRNAPNVKNVTSFDEWGILPTQNVGELASRLPGITFTTDEDNLINNISIRGQPSSYTRLNVDGMPSTGVGGDGRSATLHSFSGSMYEQIEIIAGQTPDKWADSLGGQLNLKTRSPLAQSERRRVTFATSARWFPSWSKRNNDLSGHSIKPDIGMDYTEVFDVLGGHRNLGISLLVAYQEVINPHDWSVLQYENTTNPTAFFRDYSRNSGFNDRFISAFLGRADYRVSDSTKASLSFLYNAGSEPFFHYTFVNPFVNSNLSVYDPVTNPNGAIKAGYTANRTEVLPSGVITTNTQSQMLLNPQRFSFTSKNPTGTLSFEHNWGKLKVDDAVRWSNTHWDSGAGRQREDGSITMRTNAPIGFILDNSNLSGRVFTQTAGPDVYSASSYSPYQVSAANTTTQQVPITSLIFNSRDTVTDTNEVSGAVNATYHFDTQIPFNLKGGLGTVNRRVNNRNVYPRRWYGVVGSTIPTTALMPLTEFEIQHGGQRLPVLDPAAIRASSLGNPALWYEDVNFTATQQLTNRRIMEEGVDAAYLQGDVRLGKLSILGGLRREMVSTHSFTYFRARSTLIAVEPDPFKRALLDFDKQSIHGSYNKMFPSLHLGYDLTKNLKARASWSNSYGRPALANIVASVTPNDAARTVTLGNPSLKPQTATNVDLKLEYYFNESGIFSVTGYQKKITDYIGSAARSGVLIPDTPNNGFDGLYGGYEIIQPTNLGDATVKGAELDYRQRLSFLPGLLKGLTARANYTYLKTNGKFAGTTDLSSGQIANFVPRTYNIGLQYFYKNFGASYDLNFKGRFPIGYSFASPGNGNIYQRNLTTMNAGITYKIRPEVTVFLNVNNFAEAGPEQYTYLESRTRNVLISPRTIKVGVKGQF